MRIADALNSHLNINVKLAGLSPKTVESYEVSAKHITDFFGTGERVSNGTVREIFRTICRNTSFEAVHPHTLRHSFATNMISHDVDIRYIGAMLGHESLDTTKAYTHLIDNNLRRIYEKVAQNY